MNEQRYFDALKRIARKYQTSDQMIRRGGQYGFSALEELAMAYDNLQDDAARAIHGKRRPKDKKTGAVDNQQ